MGVLAYGAERMSFYFDDDVLAHLQALITAKLRRGEPFFLSWRDPRAVGGGRSALWLHPSVPIGFHFDAVARPQLDRQLLEEMSIAALSPTGLDLDDDSKLSRTAMPLHNAVKRHDVPLAV
ncbi:hypothetical protein [Microcella alkalica]|uniref:DUF7882 family protein n=1 Tax=Microcella alkalica TaxID=355930 RepID=UPI00145D94CE|nr:hypothetical protein [Microcella alkalica]